MKQKLPPTATCSAFLTLVISVFPFKHAKRVFYSLLSLLFISMSGMVQAQTVQTFTSSSTFTPPCGVTSITVICIGGGGGGGGGGGATGAAGGGGAGGALVEGTITVVPGTAYTVTVGAGGTAGVAAGTSNGGNGGASWFGTASTIYAGGGGGGAGKSAAGDGAGGAVATGNIGTLIHLGGAGGTGAATTEAGGGGGAGGTTTAGGAGGSTGTGGTGGTGAYPGGAGGAGNATAAGAGGTAGSTYGGGGGGGHRGTTATNRAGGAGAGGEVIIIYTPVTPGATTVTGGGTYCGSATLTATGSGGTIYFEGTTSGGTSTALGTTPQTVTTSGTYYFNMVNAGCWGTQGSATVVINPIPAAPTGATATPTTVCGGQPVALTATSAGNGINWWTAATGGTELGNTASGANFTVNPLATTTYYAEAEAPATTTVTITSSGTWTVPANVTSITVNAWGGGGAGGGDFSGSGSYFGNGGGGGGGACSANNIVTVSPGQVYTVTIGAGGTGSTGNGTAGGTTSFTGAGGTVSAAGGSGGLECSASTTGASYAGGAGGSTGSTVGGGVIYAGGNGSSGNNGTSTTTGYTGTGGGAGGSGGAGTSPTSGTCSGVAAGGTGTFPGGAGAYNTSCGTTGDLNGPAGAVPGGGGAGDNDYASGYTGGAGGAGEVIITYTAYTGCSSSTRTAVTETVVPAPGSVTISGGGAVCGSTTLVASGGAGGTMYWEGTTSNGTDQSTPSTSQYITTSGKYFFGAYNGSCWTWDSVTVTVNPIPSVPTAATATPGTVCAGSPSLLNAVATGDSINWWTAATGGTLLTEVASGANYSVSPSSTTVYYAEATLAGCVSPTRLYDSVYVLPVPSAVTVSGGGSVCGSTTLTATGGTGGTIYWQNTTSNGTSTATPSSSQLISTNGTYYFNAYNGYCWGAQGSATVTVNPVPSAPTSVSASPNLLCAGQSSNISAVSTGNNINWWTAPTGGTLLTTVASGASYSVSPTTTTVYYAESQTIGGTFIDTFKTNSTWTVPANVTSATVSLWGGGGGAGGSTTGAEFANGGGGGGAANVTTTITGLVAGNTYTVTIGAGGAGGSTAGGAGGAGGTTTFTGPAGTWTASGGLGGAGSSGAGGAHAGGAAGTTGTGTGATIHAGGAGSAGNDGTSSTTGIVGDGGGAGGSGGAGVSPTSTCGSIGTGGSGTYPGGTGGYTTTSICGTTTNNTGPAGTAPGGGGGGANCWTGSYAGGQGGTGWVIVQYTLTTCPSTTRIPDTVYVVPGGAPSAVTVSGGGLVCGSATLTATGGTPGTIYWENTTSGGTDQSTPSSSQTVTTSGTYYFNAYNGACWGAQGSATVYVDSVPTTPYMVSASPNPICAGFPSLLTATSNGNTINWWSAATGGTLVGTSTSGGTLSVSPTSTTVYYAESQSNPGSGTQTFSYTGAQQTWTVPPGVTSITVDVQGAAGGSGDYNGGTFSLGGSGGRVQATYPVTTGQVLYINVGGMGATGTNAGSAAGGFNGGGTGGSYVDYNGGGGGGASDIRTGGTALTNRIFVAGGGGGGGYDCGSEEAGGPGGASTAALGAGYNCNTQGTSGGDAGLGGTLTAGGTSTSGCAGATGTLGIGGSGCNTAYSSAGGGGGYWGGGAGYFAGGGGGSSYATGTATGVTKTAGYQAGNGQVTITWTPPVCPSSVRIADTVTLVPGGAPAVVTVSGGGTACGSATLIATGGTGGTIYWEGTTSGGTSTATPSDTQIVTTSGTYYFDSYNGSCWGTQGSATVSVNPVPSVPTSVTATPNLICAGQTSNLNATSSGNNINWWTAPTGGTLLTTVASGTNFPITPDSTTVYYAETQSLGGTFIDTFSTSGTWTVPANVVSAQIYLWGGGGGAGGSTTGAEFANGGGGGGGAAVSSTMSGLTLGSTYTITIGAGGAGGSTAGGAGGAGGTTTISGPAGTWTASGGLGGAGSTGAGGAHAGGAGGTTGTGTGITVYAGGAGSAGNDGTSAATGICGDGGGAGGSGGAGVSPASACASVGTGGAGTFPGGTGGYLTTAYCGTTTNASGVNGAAPGGGGGGANCWTGTYAGGTGGTGWVIIKYTLATCPSASRIPDTVYVVPGGAPSADTITGGGTVCGSTVLTVTGGTPGTNYWQTVPGGTSTATPYTGPITVTTSGNYYVNSYNGACWSSSPASASVTVNAYAPAPSPVTAAPNLICSGQSSNLNATSAGNNINWWTAPTGGTLLTTVPSGTNYTVAPTTTTIYYAESQIPSAPGSASFSYTGAPQTWTVPAGVTSINVDMSGAAGGNSAGGTASAGNGGRVQTTLSVTPGQVLNLFVGGVGAAGSGSTGAPGAGGYNGGGSGGTGVCCGGGGGGGATDIRIGGTSVANIVAVAGGGGGTGGFSASGSNGTGGAGGQNGTAGTAGTAAGGGGGATQTAVGAGGAAGVASSAGTAGSANVGGAGGTGSNNGGGGGGGGYFGGGAGGGDQAGSYAGGGGGGSSYSSGTSTTFTTGYNSGAGSILISYTPTTGCPSATRVADTLNVVPGGPPAAVTVSGGGPACGSATLTATGGTGGTIYWEGTTSGGTDQSTPSTSQTVTTSGTYYFNAYNGSCWGAQGSATVTISAIPPAPTTVTATPSTICIGDTVQLNAVATGYNINWWTAATGGTELTTINSGYNYPVTPSTTTTYYAEAAQIQADTFRFTSCGQTDLAGPTQANVNTAYAGTNLAGSVTVSTQGIQQWTVPYTGSYIISANGASGGNNADAGFGANVTGTVSLTAGTVLDIVVGQMGSNTAPSGSDGGGGGSFVVAGGSTLYFAAGGGGGGAQGTVVGQNASTTTSVTNGSASTFGSVGAGFSASGTNFTFGTYTTVAQDFAGGMTGQAGGQAGGWPGGTAGDGGFGGGGSSCSCSTGGGGGGGGYVGGGGGGGSYTSGYGGSSYIIPSATSTSASVLSTYGNGSVTITYAGSSPCASLTRVPVTVTVNPTPGPVTVSGGGASCGSATLTATGGTGGTIYWENTSSTGTSTATPSSSQTVTTSGTYYFNSYNGTCWNYTPGSASVTINTIPAAPTSISATPAAICTGGTSALNAVSTGNGINWYTTATGGTPLTTVNSGVNYTVAPTATTTYYAETQAYGPTVIDTFVYTGGTQTWTVPAGVSSVTVYAWGGGGGAGGTYSDGADFFNSGGGGGGACSSGNIVSVSPGQTYTISVGAGGAGGNNLGPAGTAGGNGSASSFTGVGGTVSAAGGHGSVAPVNTASTNNAGGAAGTTGATVGGGVIYAGAHGSAGHNGSSSTTGITGNGGGAGGSGGAATNPGATCGASTAGGTGTYPGGAGGSNPDCNTLTDDAGVNGSVPGGGGSGNNDWVTGYPGGNGAPGWVIIVYKTATCTSTTRDSVIVTDNTPVIGAQTDTACSGVIFSFTPTGTNVPAGTTYSWSTPTGSATGSLGALTGQTAITDHLTNPTSSPITEVYTVTPSSSTGCVGASFTVSVVVNPAATISAQSTSTCSGVTFNYTITGGTIPTGTTYAWSTPTGTGFTGSTGSGSGTTLTDNLINSGSTPVTAVYSVTPTSGICNGSAFNVSVTVNAASSIPSQTANACSGDTFNYTPTGGTILSGTTYSWSAPTLGSGVTGGAAGSGSTLTDILTNSTTSAVTATYTVTPSSTGCIGSAFTVTVTVNPAPSSATISDVLDPCNGGHTAYVNVTGGSSPYTFNLTFTGSSIPGTSYTGAVPIELDAQGATSITVSSLVDANGCPAMSVTGSPVSYPSRVLTSGNTQACTILANTTQVFYDASANLMASITSGATALGNTTVITTIDAAVDSFGPTDTQHYLQRHFQITPATQAPANVCLYVSDAEVSALNLASVNDNHSAPSYYQTFLTDFSNANITQYDGLSETPLSNTSRTVITSITATQNPTVDGATFNGSWQVCFNVGGFSGFYIHAANIHSDPLPVTLINLTATAIDNKYIELNWATASETNNSGFQVERSTDGTNFVNMGWVNGHGTSTVQNNYKYADMAAQPGLVYYYRLKQVDVDGNFTYTYIVSATLQGTSGFSLESLFPNPASTTVSVGVISNLSTSTTIKITDILGREVLNENWSLSIGYNTNTFDISKFAAGTYTVTLFNGDVNSSKKLVITK